MRAVNQADCPLLALPWLVCCKPLLIPRNISGCEMGSGGEDNLGELETGTFPDEQDSSAPDPSLLRQAWRGAGGLGPPPGACMGEVG